MKNTRVTVHTSEYGNPNKLATDNFITEFDIFVVKHTQNILTYVRCLCRMQLKYSSRKN